MSLLKPITKKLDGHEPDKHLIVIIFIIVVFGLISLSSASSVIAYDKFGDAYYYFKHQLIGLGLGLIAFWFFSKTLLTVK